ncbi:MAG: hypothetical protein ACRD3T_02750 [Terriglobia bacterium]
MLATRDLPPRNVLEPSHTRLTYLAPSTAEVAGASIDTLGGTNFVSNGQRNATAQFVMDGVAITHPEGGEGSTTIVNYLLEVFCT